MGHNVLIDKVVGPRSLQRCGVGAGSCSSAEPRVVVDGDQVVGVSPCPGKLRLRVLRELENWGTLKVALFHLLTDAVVNPDCHSDREFVIPSQIPKKQFIFNSGRQTMVKRGE